jgi:hypothetical protein
MEKDVLSSFSVTINVALSTNFNHQGIEVMAAVS